jgi:hypothetical protein
MYIRRVMGHHLTLCRAAIYSPRATNALYSFLYCSMVTNVAIVCRPNRMKLEDQPRKAHLYPSVDASRLRISHTEALAPGFELAPIICVLITSIGLATLVATRLAPSDAVRCVAVVFGI